ncbi:MAG: DNRLRE domain-containing protein [Gammaproteobacteria bacterium]
MLKSALIATALCAAAGAHAATVDFQDGLNGYEGNLSLVLAKGSPNGIPQGFRSTATIDLDDSSFPKHSETQWLLRFDDLFGALGVPAGATINNATLRLFTKDPSVGTIGVHRMLVDWDRSSSWNGLGNGVTLGVDALATADDAEIPLLDESYVLFDVTSSVTAWAAGAANFGWAFLTDSTDAWTVQTDMYRNAYPDLLALRRPLLTIDFTLAPPVSPAPVPLPAAAWLFGGALCGLGLIGRRRVDA